MRMQEIQTGQRYGGENYKANPTEGKSRTFYAGNFLREIPLKDRIQQKKAQAQEKAMKIVRDAWEGDKELDDEVKEKRERIQELKQENKEAMECGDYSAIAANNKEISKASQIIRGIRQERLKYHTMTDAGKQAEDVMEEARDQVMGMAVEEAKEHLDQENELREEQAELIKEEREKQEEVLEKREEAKKSAKESFLENVSEEMPLREAMDLAGKQAEINSKIQEVLNEAYLLEEDMKGANMDMNL